MTLSPVFVVADDEKKDKPTRGVLLEFIEVPRGMGVISFKAIVIEFENSEFTINEPFFLDPYSAKGARRLLHDYLADKDRPVEYQVGKEGDNKLSIEGYVDPISKKFHAVSSIKFILNQETPVGWVPKVTHLKPKS